ncbi:MFS transporter [Staphylospora marina]|uniref:MFS transporter n=1 Tax=Staphylospora marina TaxID=2490858 RepID=UPI000F5B9AC2|nr:MFS transporter [Staphylospora marina]
MALNTDPTQRLDRSAKLLLLESGLFAVATALSGTFVNVFLWKIGNDWIMIALYNLMHYLSGAATFVLAGWLAKKIDRIIIIRLGVAFLSVFYLTVFWLGERAAGNHLFLGVLLGIGSGFFWLSFNVLYFEITERDNRDLFNGINGLIGSLAGIAAPFTSGWIISGMGESVGYRVIFAMSLGIFVLAVLVSFLFKGRRAPGSYRVTDVLGRSGVGDWKWVSVAMTAQGVREGVFTFLISVLFFVTVKSEWQLGIFFTVSSLTSMISFYLAGKFIRPRRRNGFILLGTLMMGLVVLPYAFFGTDWSIWVLGVGASFFYPFYMSPTMSTVFDVIGQTEESVRLRVEFVVARELFLAAGRAIGILLFIGWVGKSAELAHIRWFVLMVGFVQLLGWWAIRHIPLRQDASA